MNTICRQAASRRLAVCVVYITGGASRTDRESFLVRENF